MLIEGTLFDAAGRARDAALAKHDQLTTDLVVSILAGYLRCHEFVHTDDVWPLLDAEGLPPGRYVGRAFQRAQREGLMAKVPMVGPVEGVFAARGSVRSNLAPKWVYRSLIFESVA